MPPAGAGVRAPAFATVSGLIHKQLVADELGELLDDLEGGDEDYDSDAASLVRVLRHARGKELRVPAELRSAMAQASSEAYPAWVAARSTSDFELFRPHLERNVELCRRYADCFDVDEPYDALLDDSEPGLKTAELRAVFSELRDGLIGLIPNGASPADDSILRGRFEVAPQEELARCLLDRFPLREGSWRLDTAVHAFAASLGTSDIRITTRYEQDHFSCFAVIHEAGHAMYEHSIDPGLERTPLCVGASAGVHESQSRLFENLVGRSLPFWQWGYPQVQRLFPGQFGGVGLERFHAAINRVQPSLIRVDADEATYSLHIILRFELELELVAGTLAVADVPAAWNERMREYLGIEVPDDAHGALQDPHWCGAFAEFPGYAIGNMISIQLWQRIREDLPSLDQRLSEGDLEPLCDWLREHLWRYGRKYTPNELLQRIVGSGLDAKPYLGYLETKLGTLAT
jgi:carboxypeptidase Taq